MFCKKCGKEMGDNVKFCGSCGASQEDGGVNMAAAYRPPSYEFKTATCYPDEHVEKNHSQFYQDCGWQVLDMTRNQEYTGQDASGTKHYVTQTHIKMQRDKNMPNYERIKELSAKAEPYFDTSAKTKPPAKRSKGVVAILAITLTYAILGSFFCLLFLPFGGSKLLLLVPGIPAVICILTFIKTGKKKKAKNKIINEENEEIKKRFDEKKAEADKAREECRKLVESNN